MFREMRRKGQMTDPAEAVNILKEGKTGILGLSGDDGYPYTVPINYVYEDRGDGTLGYIHMHCAITGHKIDSIKRNDKVSFCVVAKDDILPKDRTTKYLSAIAFGRARLLSDPEEMRRSANMVGAKYSGDYRDLYEAETEEYIHNGKLACIEVKIEHLTGKIGKALMKERAQQ